MPITANFRSGDLDYIAKLNRMKDEHNADVASFSSALRGGRKNLIINGAMAVKQRPSSTTFLADRFNTFQSRVGKLTIGRDIGGVTTPPGFAHHIGVIVTSPYSPAASDYHNCTWVVDGEALSRASFGTANAQPLVLSAYVYSSVPGAFSGAFRNAIADRSYLFTFAIEAANAWTRVSISIPGDTSGTWNSGVDTVGAYINLDFGTGTTYTAAGNTWASGNYIAATGATSFVGQVVGSVFVFTGVQLEIGLAATDFEFIPYAQELILCGDIDDIATVEPYATAGYKPYNSSHSRKNLVVNGAFYVAQRGTTYALTTSVAYGSLDRWWAYQASSAAGVFNQVASTVKGFANSAKLGRLNGSAATGVIACGTLFESADSIRYAGKLVVLSFWAKKGANFSATSSYLVSSVDVGSGVDGTSAAQAAGSWTGQATTTQNNVLTTSYQRFTQVVYIATATKQIGLRFSYTPSGTAGADDNVYITGVQLEQGSAPTDFEVVPFAIEKQMCAWWLRIGSVWVDTASTKTCAPITMRATPTISGGGSGFNSTGTTADYLHCYQMTAAAQTLTLAAEL